MKLCIVTNIVKEEIRPQLFAVKLYVVLYHNADTQSNIELRNFYISCGEKSLALITGVLISP